MQHFTFKRKLEVLDLFHNLNDNASETERQTGIDRRTIGRWAGQEDKIRVHGGKAKRIKLPRETTARYPQLEQQFIEWIMEIRINKKRPLNIKDLRDHAKAIVSADPEPNKYDNFVVSNSWVRNFMRRNSLCFRMVTHKAQENNKSRKEQTREVVDFLFRVNQEISNFEPRLILQMDETPTYIDMLASRTIDFSGSRTINICHTSSTSTMSTITGPSKCSVSVRKFNHVVAQKSKRISTTQSANSPKSKK